MNAFASSKHTRKRCRMWILNSGNIALMLSLLVAVAGSPQLALAGEHQPVFAVGTIKPSKRGAPGDSFRFRGNRFETTNTSLDELVSFAYSLHTIQIVGAPTWAETEKFDVSAQADGEMQPTEQQWKLMIQKLLSESFRLRTHGDRKELSLCVLSVAKTGPMLKRSGGDPSGLPMISLEVGAITAANATMDDLAAVIHRVVVDCPVVDKTGIRGRYDFSLRWTPESLQLGASTMSKMSNLTVVHNRQTLPFFAAIQEQIGLNLEATTTALPVLVIDHVQKPYGD